MEIKSISRLQFRHHNEIFTGATLEEARELAIKYVTTEMWYQENPLDSECEGTNPLGHSLYAEPTIVNYAEEGGEDDPHLILFIGETTNETNRVENNRFCIIDIDKTEKEIENLQEELEKAIKSLTLITLNSDTLNLYADKTDNGTYVSGDVKTAKYHVFNDVTKYNNLMIASESELGPEGLFIYVDLTYDELNETFTFTVTNADGTLKSTSVKLPNNYLVSGYYSKVDESLHLKMKSGEEVIIDCEELIAEWNVEGDASKTPVVLTKEEVDFDSTSEHYHVEDWQDVLRADIRLKDEVKNEDGSYTKDENSTNILNRTLDGRYLYVDGKASNIIYYWNGQKSNVKEQLDNLNQIKVSQDNDNIIWDRADGFFASVKLDYISDKNKLVFTTTNGTNSGHTFVKEIQLNSVELFQNIYYDPTTEELVLTYKDDKGNLKVVRIPIGQMLDEWDVLSEGHNVKLVKTPHHVSGKDILTADAKISGVENNILEDVAHELFVRGTADNIKYEYTGDTTVKDVLDSLKESGTSLNEKIDAEIERAISAETELNEEIERIDITIGSGFSTDTHETVTYKFEQLTEKVNDEAEKLQNEINRSTEKDNEHDTKLAEQQAEIEAVSADSANSLKDIINNDHSINVDKTNPIKPVISVNLSEHEPYNTIRLEGDGLYNFIDLSYDSEKNQLIFIRSDKNTAENQSKTFQLNSVSIIDRIEYDPTTEDIIIYYHVGTEEKTVRINLRGIFREWEVYNDPDSAVKLNRTESISGTDKLSGEVIITTAHTDNILENEHGALYVPANTFVTEALSGAINTEKEERTLKDRELEDKIEAETTRAKIAEAELSAFTITAINEEKTRAEIADAVLQNAIDAEILNRQSGDTTLLHLIEDEKASRISGDTLNTNAITAEEARAREVETRIETALNDEITRAQTKEGELNVAITNETLRAQAADNELYQKIADETADRASKDAELESLINQEASRAQVAENSISERLTSEITRSTNEDQALRDLLTAETTARQEGDAELEQKILDATLTFDDTSSIDFNVPSEENNIVRATVKLQEGENIIKIGEGLYANVRLSYDAARNTIKLVTSNGEQEAIQLNTVGSLIDGMEYDAANRALVIKYHDAAGNPLQISFPVNQLFNDWEVDNPSEKSAVELTKTSPVEPDDPDKLSARVLITDDRDGDGKPDPGSDNLIEIRNNGLYVCGSAMTEAQDVALCAKNELKVLENAVIGHIIGEECGSGYTYEPNNTATYINSATSFNNADYILDQSIKNVENKVDIISGDVECIDSKTGKMYELLYGEGSTMPDCGEGAHYVPDAGSCVISAATSFYEADRMLGDQICEILEMWVSGITCTAESDWIDEGANKKMLVDVRLSHGSNATMSEHDLYTTDMNGAYIDPTRTEFTDTNALRIICLEDGPSGITPDVATKQNGIYLSNVWDCGLYYGPSDTEAKAAAEAAGYKTSNYNTDEDSSASNYNYMNNVRQSDIPHN